MLGEIQEFLTENASSLTTTGFLMRPVHTLWNRPCWLPAGIYLGESC